MQIVIEIDEEYYKFIKQQVAEGITNPLKICIANGTPRPEGHGKSIDARYADGYEDGYADGYADGYMVMDM